VNGVCRKNIRKLAAWQGCSPAVLPCALSTTSLCESLAHELTEDKRWSNLPLIDVQT
jgi:hypothetical protein